MDEGAWGGVGEYETFVREGKRKDKNLAGRFAWTACKEGCGERRGMVFSWICIRRMGCGDARVIPKILEERD